jgi:heptosyltransferase-2/heptosyltransferase-3
MKNSIKNAERIIIIDLLYLGDLLFALPFIQNLRRSYPEARIDMVVNANFFDIIEDNPYLDNVYAYDKSWSIKESWRFSRGLSKNNYDLGLNIHGNWRTAIMLKLINPDYSIGYGGKGRGIFLDKELNTLPTEDSVQEKHMVELYLNFLREMGIDDEFENQGLKINVSKEARESMLEFLQEAGINKEREQIVGINTGGSWPTKRWTERGFAELADSLEKEYGMKVIFFGGPGDVDRVERIVDLMETEPVIAAGKTNLKELAALAQLCDLFISGDTGPIHVAVSVGTPTIAIFGPSDEGKYRPYGKGHIVVKKEIDCRPCGEHECPLDHHECMEGIEVEDVLAGMDLDIEEEV